MADPRETPKIIGPDPTGTRLQIEWQDGAVSILAPRFLRVRCPCAGCVDEMTGKRTLRTEDVSADVHPVTIQYVGRYALRFEWSDGHSTGIYPFRYLRELVPVEDGSG
jgi:DUF971 family protein